MVGKTGTKMQMTPRKTESVPQAIRSIRRGLVTNGVYGKNPRASIPAWLGYTPSPSLLGTPLRCSPMHDSHDLRQDGQINRIISAPDTRSVTVSETHPFTHVMAMRTMPATAWPGHPSSGGNGPISINKAVQVDRDLPSAHSATIALPLPCPAPNCTPRAWWESTRAGSNGASLVEKQVWAQHAAMGHRSGDLGLLSPSGVRVMVPHSSRIGWRKAGPGDAIPTETNAQL